MNKCIMCQKSLGTGDTADKSKNFCNECFKKIINKESEEIEFNKCLQCNEKDQRIDELEKQLENAIVAKFKIGQTVYGVVNKEIYQITITSYMVLTKEIIVYFSGDAEFDKTEIFATKQEAEKALKGS